MQNHSRWISIAAVIAIGLLGILLLPTSGPAGRRNQGLLNDVQATIEHWLHRILDLEITGPGGIGGNLVLLVMAVAVILLAPRLALLAVAVILCLPLLAELGSPVRPGSLLSGELPQTLLVIGLLLAGIALILRNSSGEGRNQGNENRARIGSQDIRNI